MLVRTLNLNLTSIPVREKNLHQPPKNRTAAEQKRKKRINHINKMTSPSLERQIRPELSISDSSLTVRKEYKRRLEELPSPDRETIRRRIEDWIPRDPISLKQRLFDAPKHWPYLLQDLHENPITDDTDSSYEYESDKNDYPDPPSSEVSIPSPASNRDLFGFRARSRSPNTPRLYRKLGLPHKNKRAVIQPQESCPTAPNQHPQSQVQGPRVTSSSLSSELITGKNGKDKCTSMCSSETISSATGTSDQNHSQ
jgi:hypothetical protein